MSDCLNLVRMFASSKLTRFVSSSLLAQLRMSLMKLVRPRGADMLPARLDSPVRVLWSGARSAEESWTLMTAWQLLSSPPGHAPRLGNT